MSTPSSIHPVAVSPSFGLVSPAGKFLLDECHPEYSREPQLSRYMVHLWHRHGLQSEYHLQDARSRLAFLRDWFLPRLTTEGFGEERLPKYVRLYLDEPALEPPISFRPMSRLMVSLLQKTKALSDVDSASGYLDCGWSFLSDAVWPSKLPWSCVPEALIEFLNEPEPSGDPNLPTLSRFWGHALRLSEKDSRRYDIRTVDGRLGYIVDVILHRFGREPHQRLFPDYMLKYWEEGVAGEGTPSRLAYLVAFAARAADEHGRARSRSIASPSYEDVREAMHSLCAARPQFSRFWHEPAELPPAVEPSNAETQRSSERLSWRPRAPRSWQTKGVNIVGYSSLKSGLGANLLMSHDAFSSLGLPVAAFNDHWDEIRELAVRTNGVRPLETRRPVVLFHINPDAVPQAIARIDARMEEAYKIGFFLWELSDAPVHHDLGLALVDEIWTPTEYVREVYAKKVPGRVVNVGKGLRPATPTPGLSRESFGLSPSAFTFLSYFDFDSSIERKNPLATVRAFKAAFPKERGEDVALVMKCYNVREGHWGNRFGHWDALLEEVAQDGRIRLLNRYVSDGDLMALLSLCDSFVSLHRSEGFGYGPAQALWFEKPLVVTDYSGTKDYANETTAFVVPYALRFLRPNEFLYDVPGAQWAEPDIEEASRALRRVREDTAAARARAEAGSRFVREQYSCEHYARRCIERLVAAELLGAC
jgi:glycosyltransferase involved in cell wall biosynthesis